MVSESSVRRQLHRLFEDLLGDLFRYQFEENADADFIGELNSLALLVSLAFVYFETPHAMFGSTRPQCNRFLGCSNRFLRSGAG